MEPQKRACFITRFHFPLYHRSFAWRFGYYQDVVLPRLLDQDKADIAVWCEDHHRDLFRSLSDRIITFKVHTHTRFKVVGRKRYFVDFAPWSAVEGLPQYEIQIGLDSDDLILPGFVEKVLELCQGERSVHVSFQPRLYHVKTGKIYEMRPYTPDRGSPIFAIYQPNVANYIFAYEESHLKLPHLFEEKKVVREPLCYVSVHNFNDSTTLRMATREVKA